MTQGHLRQTSGAPQTGSRRRRLSPTSPRSRILDEDKAGVTVDFDRSPVTASIDKIYPVDSVLREKREQCIPRKRRTVGETEAHRRVVGQRRQLSTASTRGSPQRSRRHPILGAERGVEATETLESAGIRDSRYGQSRIREKTLCEKQPVRLRELERRRADLALKSASQMSLADAEVAGELRD
jgi:hypothetical protein